MNKNQLTEKIIQKEKWWDILSRFIDVLRINLFIVGPDGNIILPPEEGRCGGKLLTDPSLGFDFLHHTSVSILEHFQDNGTYLESSNRFNLHSFAIPINTDPKTTLAYMIVGPVILNKRLTDSEYETMCKKYGVDVLSVLHELSEIRVVSNVMINSILNLLSEIIRDNVELSLRSENFVRLKQLKTSEDTPTEVSNQQIAQEIYTNVLQDELLITFLDIALKMTQTECGSIMIVDTNTNELNIKASKGLDKNKVAQSKTKVGEGIAGSAAQENKMYVIEGQSSPNNRISSFLKRPEIKQSLVLPLTNKNGVIGVLNLHTKNPAQNIKDNVENLRYLSQLLSTAF